MKRVKARVQVCALDCMQLWAAACDTLSAIPQGAEEMHEMELALNQYAAKVRGGCEGSPSERPSDPELSCRVLDSP